MEDIVMWKTLPLDVFQRGLVVFIGPAEQLLSFYKDTFPSDAPVVEETINNVPPGVAYTLKCCADAIIWCPTVVDENTLVHEFCHAAFWIMELIKVEICDESEEVYAYMVEYMYNNIIPWYREAINKEKCE